jgi:hypothetical protein
MKRDLPVLFSTCGGSAGCPTIFLSEDRTRFVIRGYKTAQDLVVVADDETTIELPVEFLAAAVPSIQAAVTKNG